MKVKSQIWSSIISLSLFFGASGSIASEIQVTQADRFQRIEQPFPLKLAVTVGGLSLIGLELWWFIFSQKTAKKAESRDGIQKITVKVNGGYEPNRILVQSGQKVQLKFLRQDPSSCLEKVLIPDFRIAAYLPLDRETIVEFTPEKPGEYPFTCGMNMFRGIVEAK